MGLCRNSLDLLKKNICHYIQGLTAVRSRDVCDLMMREYPEKFDSYLTAQDEKRKENIRGKHQQYSTVC